MADKNSENTGSLEEREKATKELFERDIAKEGNRKDLEADDVLGSDHHEVAQTDVAMAEKADDKLSREAEEAADSTTGKLVPPLDSEPVFDENSNPSRGDESRVPKSAPTVSRDDEPTTSSVLAGGRTQHAYGLHNQAQQESHPSVDPSTESAPATVSLGIEKPEPNYDVKKLDPTAQETIPDEAAEVSSADGGDQELVVANLMLANSQNERDYSYELIGSGSDYFELVDNQILIKPGVNFDTTQSSYHSLTFQITDRSGNTRQETVVVNVDFTTEEAVIILGVPEEEAGPITEESDSLPHQEPEPDESLTYSLLDETEAPVGFVLHEDGSYDLDVTHEAYQHLGVGDSQTLIIPVKITTDQGEVTTTEIQVVVHGSNDLPIVEMGQSAEITEGASAIEGEILATDVDDNSVLTYAVSEGNDLPPGFILSQNGHYSFTAENYNSLEAGQNQILDIPITVTDDHGGTAHTILQITITGTNDTPVAEAQEVSAEEGGLVSGQLQANDVDLAEGAALSFTTSSEVDGLTLNEDGSYNFDASSYQSLGEGDTEIIEVPVTVTDDQGATAETTLTITVTGTNNDPVAEAQEVSADEGGLVNGQLQASDVDLAEGASLSFATSEEVDGLTFNEDGSYSFDASSYQSLGEGDTEIIEVPVTVTDDQGATAEITLTITVTGTNDNPVAEAQEISADEGGLVNGQLQASDVDLAEGASLSFATSSEVEGLALNEDGSYSFDASSYQTLGAGETEIIEVPVMVADDQGATAETTLTITVTGTNDAPVAEAQQTTVEEGAFAKGQLKAGDIDLAEGSALSFSTSSEVEGLTLNEDGSYSFDASSYQSLGAGETETIEVPVTVTDDQGSTAETTLTITVTGTNDDPVAEAQEVSAEEGVLVSGQLQASDIDLAEGSALSFSTSSEVEGLTLNEDGSYSFDASSYQSLSAGETETIEVPVAVADDHGATAETTLTITVTGTNDNPVAEAQEISADEGGLVNGQLQASDVDLVEGGSLSFSTSSEVEGLALNEDGSYSFDASSYQSLSTGETETIEVPVTVTDDQGATAETTLTITVTGTNDAPVAEAQQTTVEEGALAKGQLKAGDIDLAEGSALSFSTSSEVEGLTLNQDGSYSFDASSYQTLGVGETEIIEVPVMVADDQGATAETTLTITVTGTNDAPVAEAQQTTVEEGALAKGQLKAGDIDLAEGSALSFSTSSEVEGLTLNEDGSYSFDASSYQSLSAGETETIEVPVAVADDHGATAETTLTITVTGTNDNPVAEAQEISADEGGLVNGQLQARDVDLVEGGSLSFSTSEEVDGLTLNEDGSYSFDASSYQSLSTGETETIEVPVTVTDDQGSTAETTLTITVTGTNDNPVAEAQEISADEGGLVNGQLQASDVDLVEGGPLSFSTSEEVDGLSLNEDGSYSFDASSYQSLGAGETETLKVPVTVTDDQGATAETMLTITVTGTNDAPIANAEQVAVDEGALIQGNLEAGDIDLAEGASLSFTTSSEVDGLTLNEDGSYNFDASSYQSLGVGETETIEVPVTVTDDQGATAETTLTITVTGTNDAPVAEAQQTAVEEGALAKGQLKAGDIDLAEGSVLSFSTSSEVEGLTLYEDGSYSFDASFYQSLGEGQTETIEVPVTVVDDQGGSSDTYLTITVTGTNDLPTVVTEEVVVDEGKIIKGQLEADDIDLPIGASLTFSTDANVDGLTLHADGSYSFDASGYEGLDSGETAVIEVPVIVEDDHGGKAETILTINVEGIDSNSDSSGEHTGSDPDENEENRGRGEEEREEHRGRGGRDAREEHRGRGDRDDREEHRGRGGRDDREEHRGRGDREDREEHRGRGDRDDREEHRGRGGRDDREEHRGRGGRDDREEHRGRGDRDDREEHRGRGDRDDREAHRGRGDRDDREEHRGRGGRDDREEHRGRGDRDDREEHRGRGDREDRDEHRGRGDRDDREEHRGRGDGEDRDEHRGRGDREDREEHRGRGDRDDREEHRGRGDRDDREEHRGRGDREDRDEHRGRGDRDDRDEHRGRGDDDDREHHRGWEHRDNWDEHPRNGEHGERHEHRGHRFREDNEESQASPTDIQVQGGVVEEGSASGTVVATLSAIDEDSGDQFSYDLIRDDSGHFDIVGDQLVVTHGADIDYEDRSAHQISIRVTDSTGNTFTETIAINVADVQEAMSVAEEDYSNADVDDDSGLLEDSDDLDRRDELDEDSGLSTDSDYEFSEESSELAEGSDFDDSQDLDHEVREDEADNPFDGANYFDEGRAEGWTDVVQLNPDADPNADPSNPWEISVDGEQVQYDIADNALSVNPETSSQITFSDGSELTIEGVERIEW